jgi:hypothetical protein
MPTGNRRNPSKSHREAQRADRNRNNEFLPVIELQLQAVTAREATLRQQQVSRSRTRSRSPPRSPSLSPPPHQPSAYRVRPRSTDRRQRSRSPRPARSVAPRLSTPHLPVDLNPHEQAGSTVRPSPDEEESVIGWTAYSEEQNRLKTLPPRNPFAADSYRPNYEHNSTERTSYYHSTRSTSRARGRGYRGARRGGRG